MNLKSKRSAQQQTADKKQDKKAEQAVSGQNDAQAKKNDGGSENAKRKTAASKQEPVKEKRFTKEKAMKLLPKLLAFVLIVAISTLCSNVSFAQLGHDFFMKFFDFALQQEDEGQYLYTLPPSEERAALEEQDETEQPVTEILREERTGTDEGTLKEEPEQETDVIEDTPETEEEAD